MRAINHAMTGAIIGLSVSEPVVAIPLAIGSHFVLDAIPHYGERKASFTSTVFKNLLWADFILCVTLVIVITLARPRNWLLAITCATAAAGVDFMNIPRYLKTKKSGKIVRSTFLINRFHARIQWFERPPGAVVEIAWASAAIIILVTLIKR